MKFILDDFSISLGLKVNYSKSDMYPIIVSEARMQLTKAFNCQLGTFLFTYMGLPLGLTKRRMEHPMTLVTRVGRRLQTCSAFLTSAGRLEMVNSVFSSLPTFYLSSLKLCAGIIVQVDKYRMHCLWRINVWRIKGHLLQLGPRCANQKTRVGLE